MLALSDASIETPHGEVVTLLTLAPDGVDSSGEPIPGFDIETPIEDCMVWPSGSREDLEVGVQGTIDEWVVSFPAGTVIPADARARIRGRVFNAVADGFEWRNPITGRRPGTVATFRRVGTGG
ncbi:MULTISPECIES: hypothetical protein [unclassified Microbacterium]|uniref:hypothetical protein n=1 Tax=unclassified Microbacterium TaxID=2609290 RepID=UPI003864ABDC